MSYTSFFTPEQVADLVAAADQRVRSQLEPQIQQLDATNMSLQRGWEKRQRYERALREIRDQDPTDNALDPQWAGRIASAALDEKGNS